MRDLDFISGRFFDFEIPKEKRYLLKYFTTDVQVAFLRYYLVFGDARRFVDHTGHFCSKRLQARFLSRYRRLTAVYDKAKQSLTEEGFATLQQLESGQYPLTGKAVS